MLLRLEQVSWIIGKAAESFAAKQNQITPASSKWLLVLFKGRSCHTRPHPSCSKSRVKSFVFDADHTFPPFCKQVLSHWKLTQEISASVWAKSYTVLSVYQKMKNYSITQEYVLRSCLFWDGPANHTACVYSSSLHLLIYSWVVKGI